MNQVPSIGRIVHATIAKADGELVVRAAIIVQVWGAAPTAAVNVQVFTDGDGGKFNDAMPNVVWKTSLTFADEAGTSANTWSWPVKA